MPTSASPNWPNWNGKTVAIIASGPSVKKADVELLKDRMAVLAIKRSVELAPWADAVYGCDGPWWKSVRGLPTYTGPKFAYDPKACGDFGLTKVSIPNHGTSNELLFDEVGTVGGGGSSGFQALNLAVQFGAVRVLLLGFDCQGRSGIHWYGRNTWDRAGNPGDLQFRRWTAAFKIAAEQLAQRGVEVINASPITDLKAFPRRGVADTLKAWGLS